MKRALVHYKRENKTVELRVILSLKEYENSNKDFCHIRTPVVEGLEAGERLIINNAGGYCFECRDVKIIEILD